MAESKDKIRRNACHMRVHPHYQQRIVLFHYTSPTVIGGVEAVIAQQTKLFTAAGFPTIIVAVNKDEEAFQVIRQWGGVSIGVGNNYPLKLADEHLASFEDVRNWLRAFITLQL